MLSIALCSALLLWSTPTHAPEADVEVTTVSVESSSGLSWVTETAASWGHWAARALSAMAALAQPEADLAQERARVLLAMDAAGLRLDAMAARGVSPAVLLARMDQIADSPDVQALLNGGRGTGEADTGVRTRVCQSLLPSEQDEARRRRASAPSTYGRLPGPYQAAVDSADEAATLVTALAAETRAQRSGMDLPADLARVLLEARSDQRYVDALSRLNAQAEGYTFMLNHLGVSTD